MIQNKRKAALIPLIALIAVCAVVLAIVSSKPYDRPSKNLANSFGNVKNDAMVATDGSLFFYVDSDGVLRCRGEEDTYRIAEQASCVNPYQTGVIYLAQGQICFSQYNGNDQTVYAKDVDYVEVSGKWLFYTRDRQLYKQRIGSGQETPLNITVNQYAVTGTYTYYIGDDGYLYYVKNDGTGATKFFNEKMTQFQFYRDYIFFVSDKGALCQTFTANAAYNETLLDECKQFVINDDGVLLYEDGKGLHYWELTVDGAKPHDVKLTYQTVDHLNYIDSLFYCYVDGTLISMQKDGSEQTKL